MCDNNMAERRVKMANGYVPLQQIADDYRLAYGTVWRWTKKGLPYKIEKRIGFRPRRVVRPEDVKAYLDIGISDAEIDN